jgi:hypothetical protein
LGSSLSKQLGGLPKNVTLMVRFVLQGELFSHRLDQQDQQDQQDGVETPWDNPSAFSGERWSGSVE